MWVLNPIIRDAQNLYVDRLTRLYLFQVEMKGLTNLIKFDNQGFRTDFLLDIIELSSAGIRKVGDWNSTQGVNFTRSFGDLQQDIVDNLKNKTLVISSILSDPYCMRKDSSEKLTGNNQFEGYAIDLIHEISKILGFNYTFRLVPDGRYGSLNKQTGLAPTQFDFTSFVMVFVILFLNLFLREWDGMVRELLEQRADLAIGDLTITYEREAVVDFSMPFMNLGISVLYRKPVKQPPNLFSFLSPLSLGMFDFEMKLQFIDDKIRLIEVILTLQRFRCMDLYGNSVLGCFSIAFHSGSIYAL